MTDDKQLSGESQEQQPNDGSSWRASIAGWNASDLLDRYGRHLLMLAVIVVGLVAVRIGFDRLPLTATPASDTPVGQEASPTSDSQQPLTLADLPAYNGAEPVSAGGVFRRLNIHTVIPSRPRLVIITYTVQQGDSLFGIADKYGLQPETILWGNYDTLEDNPHALAPDQELNILPVDGTYYQWHEGDTLDGVATFFSVEPQDILDWPGNNLNPGMDFENPDIEPGTYVVIPGGKREFVSWQAPRVTRANPAAARILGPGYCGSIVDGAIGNGAFVWPTNSHSVSGNGFSSYHPAIDIGGSTGNAIYASDSGVVVYAGWNNYGYGNLVILDHGNGWQSLYAHLDTFGVGCGQSIFQGSVLGGMGSTGNSTGPHLHFELQSDTYGKVNPLNFLP